MILSSFQKGADGLLRNIRTTIPTILVIAIVLTLFHGLLAVKERAEDTLKLLQQKFSVTVYLKDNADPFEVSKLLTELEARTDVIKPVVYTSKEDAWDTIRKTFSLDNELLKKYQFSLPASITITPKSLDDTTGIEAFLNNRAASLLKDGSVTNSKQKSITSQMLAFVSSIRQTTLSTMVFFIALFLIGSALLIGSAVHLGMIARHREIGIMKLMGASHTSILLPFVLEGVLMSVIAFLLHLALLLALPISIENAATYKTVLLLSLVITTAWGALISFLTAHTSLKHTHIL